MGPDEVGGRKGERHGGADGPAHESPDAGGRRVRGGRLLERSSTAAPAAATPAGGASRASAGRRREPGGGGSSGEHLGGAVTVIGTWTGAEQESSWRWCSRGRTQTGAKVNYTGTRDLNAVLTTGIRPALLPDLAGLPGPGQMAEW